mmetsp:Transcript_5462/g.12452  ORF Transcript_5462/g.12452 Transcript_5462/m.12452 type:complete len:95 (+) Transcript_5462:71-355(+)|eukprot:CAMPEP_0172297462 /NCGR_PEP_ID=MMETSP1058-20130122/478_1 /TAXON_ID=83371 /ORGANISM="Detonula confervacea, Strain CCMP 353" /LENGTH=94 /DNA_ID=CAMNT_0013006619 /DNA_START=71 /DNA_END=355 /DNA_ORIENTATION=+
MAIEFDATILVALLVGAAVIAVGLVLMNQQKVGKTPTKRAQGRPKNTPTPVKSPTTPPQSPTVTKKIATGTGSVRTPAGRRSARIARKSLEHND